jgi:hypothetical protein
LVLARQPAGVHALAEAHIPLGSSPISVEYQKQILTAVAERTKADEKKCNPHIPATENCGKTPDSH